MTQAKRKTGHKKSAASRSTGSSHIFVFLVGIGVGVAGTMLYRSSDTAGNSDLGEGIKNLYDSVSQTLEIEKESGSTKKTVAKPEEKTSYDFYRLLPKPEFEVLTGSDGKTDAKSENAEPVVGKTRAGEFYMLQVGSYPLFKDADQLKAKLALQGFETHIQKSTIAGKGKYYRVRLGPFIDLGKMSESTRRLKKMGIEPIKYKVTAADSN